MTELFTYSDSPDFVLYLQDPAMHGNLWYALVESDGNTKTFTDIELETFRQKFAPEITSTILTNQIMRFGEGTDPKKLIGWVEHELSQEIATQNYDVLLPFLSNEKWEDQIAQQPCFNIHLLLHWFSLLTHEQQKILNPMLAKILPADLNGAAKETAFVFATIIIILEIARLQIDKYPSVAETISLVDFIDQISQNITDQQIQVTLTQSSVAGEYDPNSNVLYLNTQHPEISPLVVIHELYHHYQDSLSQPPTRAAAEFAAHVAASSLNLMLLQHCRFAIDNRNMVEVTTPPDFATQWQNRANTKEKSFENYVSGLLATDSQEAPNADELASEEVKCMLDLMQAYKRQSFAATEQIVQQMDIPQKNITRERLRLNKRILTDSEKLAQHIRQTQDTKAFQNALLYHALKLNAMKSAMRQARYRQNVLEPFLTNFDFSVVPSGFDGVAS